MQHPTPEPGSAVADPGIPGTNNDALLQALRNLWPILSPAGRREAKTVANTIKNG